MEKSEAGRPTRVRSQAGATRCPFCHEDCPPEADVVVCRGCLARHHAGCWTEGKACASCGGAEGLSAPVEAAQPAEQPWVLGMTRREVGLWVLLVGTAAFLLGMIQALGAFEQMFAEVGVPLPWLTEQVLWPSRHPSLATLAVVAWVATAALSRRHRLFNRIVLVGVLIGIPLAVVGLFLPLIEIIQRL